MRTALLAFLATRLLLAAALLVLPALPAWRGGPEVPLRWHGTEEGGRRYLYHPSPLVDAFVRHDAAYYVQVAALWYAPPPATAKVKEGFLPGYPVAIRAVAPLVGSLAARVAGPPGGEEGARLLLAALLVSNLAAFGSVVLLVRLVRDRLGPAAGRRAGVALAVNPLAFLLSAGVSESLFLLLVLVAFSSAGRNRFLVAGVAGGCASFVRALGVAMALPLALHALGRPRRGRVEALAALVLVPAGLLVALVLMGEATGDPWIYFTVQKGYGHGGFPTLEGVADLFRWDPDDGWERWRDLLQLAALAVGAVLTVVLARAAWTRRVPWSWPVLAALLLLVPVLAGAVISLPRYLVPIFPLYAAAALVLPGGRTGGVIAAVSVAAQVALLLTYEAHLPLVI